MRKYNWNYTTSITHLQKRRPCVQPNFGFVDQLNQYYFWTHRRVNKSRRLSFHKF